MSSARKSGNEMYLIAGTNKENGKIDNLSGIMSYHQLCYLYPCNWEYDSFGEDIPIEADLKRFLDDYHRNFKQSHKDFFLMVSVN